MRNIEHAPGYCLDPKRLVLRNQILQQGNIHKRRIFGAERGVNAGTSERPDETGRLKSFNFFSCFPVFLINLSP